MPPQGQAPRERAGRDDRTRMDIRDDRTRVDMRAARGAAAGPTEQLRQDAPRPRSGAAVGDWDGGDSEPRHGAHGKTSRKSLLTTGVIGGAIVLAMALVAVVVFKSPTSDSSNSGLASADAASASLNGAGATASATAKSSASAKATASPKATKTAAAKATPTATKPTVTVAAAPATLSVPAGWQLAFDPSFSGSLDTSTWSTCYYWASSAAAGCNDNPTDEKEWYIPSQVSESGGDLDLTAKQETTPGTSTSGAAENYTCRSGMVTTKSSFSFTYGLISVTAKLPFGPGLWPALWLAASNEQWPPELDIMEHWYSEEEYKVYQHYDNAAGKESYLGGAVPTPVDLSAGFNTFSLLWTSSRVTWYLNGTQVYTSTTAVPQQAMYFLANVADDSTATGACTGTMEISSVKVWQP